MTVGIYRIRNIKTGKIYIGQSTNVEIRFENHLKYLRNGNHKSSGMQRDYNRWLRECYISPQQFIFEVEVLKECKPEELVELEKLFIFALKPGYNSNMFADYNANKKLVQLIRKQFGK